MNDYDPVTPVIVCYELGMRINPLNITSMTITRLFDDDTWRCALASHRYDFRLMTNLQYLSICCGLVEFLTFHNTNLITLKVRELTRDRNEVSYRIGFNDLVNGAFKLEYLEIDEIPHDFSTQISPVLHSLTITSLLTPIHCIVLFLRAHQYSLRYLHLKNIGVNQLFKYCEFHGIRFHQLRALALHLSEFDSSRESKYIA